MKRIFLAAFSACIFGCAPAPEKEPERPSTQEKPIAAEERSKTCFPAKSVQKVVHAKGKGIRWKGRRFQLTYNTSLEKASFQLKKGTRISPQTCEYMAMDMKNPEKVLGKVTVLEAKSKQK